MAVFYRFQDSGLDDFDPTDNYVQMGFRPGFSIQARELTQMQTILQAQITALARRFLQSGSIIDASLSFSPGGGAWSGTLGVGYVYIEPLQKELGYFIYNDTQLAISSINLPPPGGRTDIYISWEEVQVNPDGEEHLPAGGYAGVSVDGSLKDNAQGFSNYSAPGASRYQINIVGTGSYDFGTGTLPVNSAVIAYIQEGVAYYADTNTQV